MDNNEIKFDPNTGEPINNIQNSEPKSVSPKTQNNDKIDNLQSIATVDQANENFINNIQQDTKNQTTKKEEKTSYLFIIIIFMIIFAAIFFLFPIIIKHI